LRGELEADRVEATRRRGDVAPVGVRAHYGLDVDVTGRGRTRREESTVGARYRSGSELLNSVTGSERFHSEGRPSTEHRKKPINAMAALASFASDFDVIADWYYYYATRQQAKEYEEEGATVIPPHLINALLASCVIGTILWVVLATDGRILMPLMRPLGIEGISTGYVLLLCVLFEDLPQVLLTSLLDDYYEEDETFSSIAVFNLCTSVYDTMIKIAEAYDERHDVVETGVWCKAIYRGHRKSVSSLAILPSSISKEYHSPVIPGGSMIFDDESQMAPKVEKGHQPSRGISSRHLRWSHKSQILRWRKQSTHAELMARQSSPPFLTGSHDGTVRLWDPSHFRPCRRKFKCHSDWVTSVCVLGTNVGFASLLASIQGDVAVDNHSPSKSFGSFDTAEDVGNVGRVTGRFRRRDQEKDEDTCDVYFLTGSRNGTIKLWSLSSKTSLMTYRIDYDNQQEQQTDGGAGAPSDNKNAEAVTSLLTLDTATASHFISGHRDSSARLWDAATGDCLRVYRGHSGWITSLCGTGDGGKTFVTGSGDATAKVWDAKRTSGGSLSLFLESFEEAGGWNLGQREKRSQKVPKTRNTGLVPTFASEEEIGMEFHSPVEKISIITFSGHSGAIFSVAELEPKKTIVTGSADRTAKVWSIETGSCLSTLRLQSAVSVVAAFDEHSILTGSFDRTAKLWDVDTGDCIRTFGEHGHDVTGIASCGNGRTFVTTSSDSIARLWTVTTANMQQLIQEAEDEYYKGHDGELLS